MLERTSPYKPPQAPLTPEQRLSRWKAVYRYSQPYKPAQGAK